MKSVKSEHLGDVLRNLGQTAETAHGLKADGRSVSCVRMRMGVGGTCMQETYVRICARRQTSGCYVVVVARASVQVGPCDGDGHFWLVVGVLVYCGTCCMQLLRKCFIGVRLVAKVVPCGGDGDGGLDGSDSSGEEVVVAGDKGRGGTVGRRRT